MFEGEGPDFVCIGAQKAGTTWLWDNLRVQPGIWLPPVKELHFFNTLSPHESLLGVEPGREVAGRSPYRDLLSNRSLESWRWLRRFYWSPPTTQWYYSLFPRDVVGERLTGDVTPAYTTLDERGVAFARRVLKPDCRVLFIVRNPIERAWSSVKMLNRWRGSQIAEQDVDAVIAELGKTTHRLRGDYVRAIRVWKSMFESHFAVLRYDELVRDPESFLRRVLTLLGAEGEVELGALEIRSNADHDRMKMPDDVRGRLRSALGGQIEELDELLPGVAEAWL